MKRKFRPILISAFGIFFLISGATLSQTALNLDQIEVEIAQIQEETIKIKAAIEEIRITILKTEIAKIENEIAEKQAIVERAKGAGINKTAEIPDWIMQGLPAPTSTAATTPPTTATTTVATTTQTTAPPSTAPSQAPAGKPTIPSLTLAAQIISISTTNYPNFLQATIDPLEVKVGDIQNMIVKLEDPDEVNWVKAEIEHDLGKDTVNLALAEGNSKSGQWVGQWTVHDTVSKTYRTTIIAQNKKGKQNSVTLAWRDPCSPPKGGDWTLDGNCSITGVNGVDNGNFTVSGGYTLTIQNGATWVINSGKTMTKVSGTVSIVKGGTMKKTNLWMIDADNDGYSPTSAQYAQDSAPTNGKRRKDMASSTAFDYNDGNPLVYPGTRCGFGVGVGASTSDTFIDESKIASKSDMVVGGNQSKLANACAGIGNWGQTTGCSGINKCYGEQCLYWAYTGSLADYQPSGVTDTQCTSANISGDYGEGADKSPDTYIGPGMCSAWSGFTCYQYTCTKVTAYKSSGTLTSNNLLSGGVENVINSFYYNASALGTGLKVQFSKDNVNWYNAAGTANGWTDCTATGGATISLSALGWTVANFYYRASFSGDTSNSPVLNQITLNYALPLLFCSNNAISGSCEPVVAGEYSLPVCKKCDGSSLEPVNIADNTQDTVGSNLCNQTCKKCSAGSCVNQLSSEDLFSQCTAVGLLVVNNSASNKTCATVCGENTCQSGLCSGTGSCVAAPCVCESIGMNAEGNDTTYWINYLGLYCASYGLTGDCNTGMPNENMSCGGGYYARCTNCRCVLE